MTDLRRFHCLFSSITKRGYAAVDPWNGEAMTDWGRTEEHRDLATNWQLDAKAQERDDAADARDAVANARDALADRRDAESLDLDVDTELLAALGEERDALARMRDREADGRDIVATLRAFARNHADAHANRDREASQAGPAPGPGGPGARRPRTART